MTPPNIEKDKIVENTPNERNSIIVENEKKYMADEKHSSVSSAASPKKQLLGLAKSFSLDSIFLPEDKQAPIEDRSFRRIKLSKLRQQQNIEAIIVRAMQYCPDNTLGDRADQDWFSQFVILAEGVSNTTMQNLWAKILAREVSNPGSFSLKTLQVFRTMSISEAKLFAKACSIAVTDYRKENIRIISGAYQTPKLTNFFNKKRHQHLDLNQLGLSYTNILTLADYRLMFEQETESHPINKGEKIQFTYHTNPLNFIAKKSDCILTFYKFTPIATELALLIKDNDDLNFLATIKAQLTENFIIEG